MHPDRWRRIESLLDTALDLPPADRSQFLQRECADDPGLQAEVLAILEGADAPGLLDKPAARVAAVVPDADPDGPFQMPERVGAYRLERVIGQGGMGTVFLAHRDDGHFDQRVALKLVRRGMHLDPRMVRRFRDERQILAALSHPGIARLLDGGLTEDGLPFFAMEYVEGEAIDRYCNRNGLDVKQRLALFVRVCDALAHAHAKQIVHRDIKPSNILVSEEGHPRLLDFGIAKLVAPDATSDPTRMITGRSERLLTPEYASPEQIKGEPVVIATDVYCLGVVLYELLTGQRPFRRSERSAHELEQAVVEEDPTRPSEVVREEPLRKKLKGDLDSIVLTAMSKEPERRYPSARELGADIQRHLAGLPVTTRGSDPVYRLRRWARRHRIAVQSAAAVAVLTTILASWAARSGFPILSGRNNAEQASAPVFAVGSIADYRGDSSGTGPLTDMLATNLVRIPDLQVTSTARLLELIERSGGAPTAAAFAAAARQAGASDLLEGGLHSVEGSLVLALRQVDLASGSVRAAWRLEGKDFFSLVDQATASLAASLGRGKAALGPGELKSGSMVAWRFYEAGLRRMARGENRGAEQMFEAALQEDSTFAMAAFYWLRARYSRDIVPDSAQQVWLAGLAARTNDRDRLHIQGWLAFWIGSPALNEIADSLITRHPHDVESQYLAAFARMARADYPAAFPFLHRVIEADSANLARSGVRCLACEALNHLVYAYIAVDSIPRAHQVALNWTRQDPESKTAWANLSSVLDVMGQPDEAIAARRRATPLDDYDDVFPAIVRLRASDFAVTDQVARAQMEEGADDPSTWLGFWVLTISLRQQARWRELQEIADRRFAEATPTVRASARARRLRMTQGLALLEAGRSDESFRIFDSLTRAASPFLPLGSPALQEVYQYTLLAEAALATGNLPVLLRSADSAERWAIRSRKVRELGMATHARALVSLARHDTAAAILTLEKAIFSPTLGFTRSNYHLARLYLARGEPRKAINLLRQALQGGFESTNYFVTHTELHELIARAYTGLGVRDSAAPHWRWVSAALAQSDPEARARLVAARRQLVQ